MLVAAAEVLGTCRIEHNNAATRNLQRSKSVPCVAVCVCDGEIR